MAFASGRQFYSDKILNRFKKTNLYYETDPYIVFQDPTYLGFKLFFLFDNPDSKLLSTVPYTNTAMGYLERIGDKTRQYYLKRFVEHLKKMNSETPWFFQSIEGLQDAWKHGYNEADFKPALPADRKISIKTLESIDLRMTALMDLYRKACFDWPNRREIVPKNLRQFTVYIYCYESRKINYQGKPNNRSLINLKAYAKLDEINQRQVDQNRFLLGIPDPEPKNLPNLKDPASVAQFAKQGIDGIANNIKDMFGQNTVDKTDSIDDDINRLMFKFELCEWLPDESGVIGTKINNVTGEAAEQTIAFSYRNVFEENLYNIYAGSGIPVSDFNYIMDQSALDYEGLAKALKDKFQEQVGGFDMKSVLNSNFNALANKAVDMGVGIASNYLNSLLLGNVYGFSAANVAGAAQGVLNGDPSQLISVAQNAISNLGGSNKNDSHPINGDPNIYDSTVPSLGNASTSLNGGNVFEGFNPSKGNDNGPDSKYESPGNPEASKSNG